MKRALDMHKKMKEHAIYYNVIADGQNMFRSGEAQLGQLLNTRAWPLKQDTKGVCDWTWNEGISWGACWMVPKGATGGKAIWEFINSTLGSGGPGRAAQDQRLRPDQSRGIEAARCGMEHGQSRRSGELRQDAARRHCVVR